MNCPDALLLRVREAVESISYGSVTITLSEKGTFVELTTEKKVRIEKEKLYPKGTDPSLYGIG